MKSTTSSFCPNDDNCHEVVVIERGSEGKEEAGNIYGTSEHRRQLKIVAFDHEAPQR